MDPEPKISRRTSRLLILVLIIFLIVFLIGLFGFRILFKVTWLDAFYIVALIISNLDLEVTAVTRAQKLFIGIYVLIAGLLFIAVVGAVFDRLINHDV